MSMAQKDKPAELWFEFLRKRFGPKGGQELVVNTNPESREKYPKVEVFTLLKTDDRFRRQVLTDYRRWRQTKKEKPERRQKEPIRVKSDLPVPQGARDIHKLMRDAGHELYVVGGAVRDHVLGKKPKDFDLATEATPDRVIELLSEDPRFAKKLDLTGKQFGVVRVRDPAGEEYEIATFREDIGEGRRPEAVKFTTIEEDVNRRDLTINALFYDLDTNEVVDYVGGLEDAKKGIIRTVGKPEDRFREDKLRVLRVLRFAGRMGSKIDPETAEAIKRDPSLEEVSSERIRDEFLRGITSAKDPRHYLKMVEDMDLFDQIFPGLKIHTGYLDTLDPTMQMISLLRDNKPDQIARVMQDMKYTRDEIRNVLFFLKMRGLKPEQAFELKKSFKAIKPNPKDILGAAKILGKPSAQEAQAFVDFAQAPPALTGKQLMERGVKKGPEMGAAIAKAEREAYESLLGVQ